ncbi:MAG: Gar1/Naf1 binding region [Candidatus Diapherotrites archaeon]|nr:Gar1/Naf1 binding region [Candidatus Diapherotrites archaeon]MDN5367087.1 Gar1/Naf1 binding region [Candidatus Diapherotrites archaeon]
MRSGTMTFKNLSPVGKYLHTVNRYHVIRGDGKNVPKIGAPLYSRDGKKLGVVADVFGPVSRPYVLVKGKKAQEYFARPSDLLGKTGV